MKYLARNEKIEYIYENILLLPFMFMKLKFLNYSSASSLAFLMISSLALFPAGL